MMVNLTDRNNLTEERKETFEKVLGMQDKQ